jgi:hypothetical protein
MTLVKEKSKVHKLIRSNMLSSFWINFQICSCFKTQTLVQWPVLSRRGVCGPYERGFGKVVDLFMKDHILYGILKRKLKKTWISSFGTRAQEVLMTHLFQVHEVNGSRLYYRIVNGMRSGKPRRKT